MRGYLVNIEIIKNRPIRRKLKIYGMDISIETDKGEVRNWFDPNSGEHGSTTMKYPYGYIKRTKGADDEQIDVYVGPDTTSDSVFIIKQMAAPDFKEYDEDKVMLGFESEKQAKMAYLQHYNDEKFLGSIKTMSVDEFKSEFITKALPGNMMGVNLANTPQAMTPVMPAMGVPNPMMPMAIGPPPLDVETMDGVKNALQRIGSMKDTELLSLTAKIWGDGYQFIEADIEHVRSEITGFLLDQRDLLEMQWEATKRAFQASIQNLPLTPNSLPEDQTLAETNTMPQDNQENLMFGQ